MRVCVLTPTLDAFKGGNHLPLLGAVDDTKFTVLTNRVRPKNPDLPSNVSVEALGERIGNYYYGCSDYAFARAVLKKYPPDHAYWKQFDVIHLNQTMGPALLALQATGVPVCFLIHHPVSADLQVALEESSFFKGILWRAKYALLRRWQKRMTHVFRVATVSQTAAKRIVADYGCDASRITVVPNGIAEGKFAPDTNIAFDVIAIGSFIHPRKGFRYLVDAYRKLSALGFTIADIGRRSDKQRAVLSTISGVHIFGTVDVDQLHLLLQESSALISTSLYEGFGLSLVEALSNGKPAFAFDGGAVSEVLSPIDPQLIVPLRDADELVRRTADFLRLPEAKRKAKGEQYRNAVLERYSLQDSANALRKLYKSLAV